MKPRLADLGPYLKLFRPFFWWTVGGLVLSVLTLSGSIGLLGLSGGFLTATGLAGLVPETAQLFNVVIPAGGIRLFALVRTASRWSERVTNHEATLKLLGQLRVWLYGRFSRLSPRQLGLWHGAEVLNRLTKDIDFLDNLFVRILVPIGAATILMGAVVAWAWTFTPVLALPAALLAFLGVVAVPAALYFLGKTLSPRLVIRQEALRRALLDLVEGLDDLILHRPAWDAQRQKVLSGDLGRLDDQTRSQRRGSVARAFLVLAIGLAVWATLGLAATLPPGQVPEGPWFVALALVVLGTGEALVGLPAAWVELPGTALAARRLSDLAEQEPNPAYPETFSEKPQGTEIRVEGISFGYGSDSDPKVLDGVSCVLAPGDHVALVGPSGEGKTTLVRLLTRLEDPTLGNITLGNTNLKDWPENDLRSAISCAMQDPWTFTATLGDNLRLGAPEASPEGLWRILDLVGLGDQVRQWPDGLGTWVDEGGQSLSGGQRRRLALARALLRRAPVTILDEPTEGLDAEAAQSLVEAIRQELAGKTLVWVTHRSQGLGDFPQIWTLSRGKLVTKPKAS